METDILSTFHSFRTTKKLWLHLQATYSGKTSMARVHSVFQALARCKQGDQSLMDYYATHRRVCDEFKDLFLYPPDSAIYDERLEQIFILAWVSSISSQYNAAKPFLLGQASILILATTFHTLREIFAPGSSMVASPASASTFLANRSWGLKDSYSGKARGGPALPPPALQQRSRLSFGCRYCKQEGHLIDDCPVLARKNRRKVFLAQQATSGPIQDAASSENLTPSEEIVLLSQHIQELTTFTPGIASQPLTPRAILVCHSMSPSCLLASISSWIVDSSATDYMTRNQSIISRLTPASLPLVQIANGFTCPIEGAGTVRISQDISLPSVLYVPIFSDNLLSVSKAANQLYCSVIFTHTHCTFQEVGTQRLIGTAYKGAELYRLENSPVCVAYLSQLSARDVHCQLGHPSLPVLKQLRPEFQSINCTDMMNKSLFLVGEIGGNDYNVPFLSGVPSEKIRSFTPSVIGEISSAITELIGLGAKTLVVPGNLPIGCIPTYLMVFKSSRKQDYEPETGCLKWMNEFSKYHNRLLVEELEKLRKLHPSVTIIYADYFGAAMEIFTSPEQFGFKDPLVACCGGEGPYGMSTTARCGNGGYKVCDDPQKYASWDGFHPSEAAYKAIAIGLLRGSHTHPPITTTTSSCPQLDELKSSVEYKVLYDF